MRTFHYSLNHRADEAYMEKMCRKGWAARSLVEGVWTFEPCKPGQYVYRVGYLRGKSAQEVEKLKNELAARGIEFVSRYSFWAIFRSEKPFELTAPEEEYALCQRIRKPMIAGSLLSWIVFAAGAALSIRVSVWFVFLSALIGIYAAMCTCLAASYTGLIHRLKKRRTA